MDRIRPPDAAVPADAAVSAGAEAPAASEVDLAEKPGDVADRTDGASAPLHDLDPQAPALEVTDVTREYQMGGRDGEVVRALRGVSFAVAPGETVAIVGPSGSGKSTLLHLMGALDRPTTGSVRFSGVDVADLDDLELARLRNASIGFVFQQFQLLARTSALDNVGLGLVYAGVGRKERRRRAADALEAVGLGHRTGHRPNQLSGGEQQRVAVARALVSRPSVILADEPTGNLDTRTGAAILELLTQRTAAEGVSLVIITHDMEVAEQIPRILRIRDGEIEEHR